MTTTRTLGAELLSLPEIFESHLFTIPDYQRGYAWEAEQVKDLLKDIDHLMNDGMDLRHYTGTLVLSRPERGEDGEYDVVDGQQRLTSLVILMRVLSEYLDSHERQLVEQKYLWRGTTGNRRAVLKLNSDTRQFHERVVLGNGNPANQPASLEAHERLLDARKLMDKWVKECMDSGISGTSILKTLETELGFLVYAPKEDAETGIMFEVINNRGKPLSELEKVKNYLIYCCVKLGAKELRNGINTDWSGVLRDLNDAEKVSSSDEGAFLRYCVAVHFKLSKTDSQYGYDELKKRLAIDEAMKSQAGKDQAIGKIDAFVQFLKTAALWYARLYGRKHQGLEAALITILDQIRAQQRHASIMPLFLALVIKLEGNGNDLIKLLKLLEILNFRVYMARRMTPRNDTGQGDLYYYASRYYHDELETGEKVGKLVITFQEQALERLLVRFILWYAPDEKFMDSYVLEAGSPDDFYRWGGLRYFLMNYEAHINPKKTIRIDDILLSREIGKSGDYLSVEHLWAVEHRNQEGENNRSIDSFEKRRLGNFVLLELRSNIQGSNLGLEQKLPIYLGETDNAEATDLKQVRLMAKDARQTIAEFNSRNKSKNYYSDLHSGINEKQEARYMEFAENRWSVESYLGYKQCIKEMQDEE